MAPSAPLLLIFAALATILMRSSLVISSTSFVFEFVFSVLSKFHGRIRLLLSPDSCADVNENNLKGKTFFLSVYFFRIMENPKWFLTKFFSLKESVFIREIGLL